MAIYPKVVTIHYSDNDINIKIPVRARVIKLDKYSCPKCYTGGTLKDIAKSCEPSIWHGEPNKFGEEKTQIKDKLIPTSLVSKKDILCPSCYLRGDKVVLTYNIKNLICFYVEKRSQFVSMGRILNRYLPIIKRWNDSFVFNKNKISGYGDLDKIKDFKTHIKELKEEWEPSKEGKRRIKYTIHGFTEKQLWDAHEIYEQKKVEKHI